MASAGVFLDAFGADASICAAAMNPIGLLTLCSMESYKAYRIIGTVCNTAFRYAVPFLPPDVRNVWQRHAQIQGNPLRHCHPLYRRWHG